MKNITKYILIGSAALLGACEPSVDSFMPSRGTADFSNYVAVGDSYTAGYTDGALGKRGQESGFSCILATQLAHVGGNGFHQPEVKEGSVGSTTLPDGSKSGYYELKVGENGLAPVPGPGNMAIFADRLYNADKPFQNFGIPGAKSSHLLAPGYATLNPFYARFASSSTTTVLADVLVTDPSFISLWIGGNDVLTYALEGGEADQITDPVMFTAYMNGLVSQLFANGRKGAVANIPSINDIPYFNHILSNGHLPLIIKDESAPGEVRQLLEGEKILLGASPLLEADYGQSIDKPLPAKYVLDLEEVKAINDATEKYNKVIYDLCHSSDFEIAFVDLHEVMKELTDTGIVVDGQLFSSKFVTGGAFSLDGIHANGKGSAIIANTFIDAINKKYNASVPRANVNDYDGVLFP